MGADTIETINAIIKQLELLPHPEGGFYKESHRSDLTIAKECLPEGYSGMRNVSTAIYFLLTSDNFSAFHKIHQDEVWHFYKGSPISLHVITKNGVYENHIIGPELELGQVPQHVVQGGDWFASEVSTEDSYSLAGCTVSPGFDFADFEMAQRDDLIKQFPQFENIISRLCRA
ncbi:cupin domain-containing protein [Lutimonas sp.]|uniref:cupin domain-containing protein n=1 Tax=Lutimonas sp. TaxID=1872403 RepID=UPI003D9B4465